MYNISHVFLFIQTIYVYLHSNNLYIFLLKVNLIPKLATWLVKPVSIRSFSEASFPW